jgi:succinoglycan biosynthesis protein ExoM
MIETKIQVCVTICTFKRPELLLRLMRELIGQHTGGLFFISIVVVDNDVKESARSVVREFSQESNIQARYYVERTRNIALARNRAVANATGDYLAFIDDDEFPVKRWLYEMVRACNEYGADGVLGPVLPHFETQPPAWLKRAGFYERPRHRTGFVMDWQESRTGNVLLKRRVVQEMEEVFRPAFGNGGEDQDFFRRVMAAGRIFIWCDEAEAYETVPPHRWKRRFLIKRALLRGKTTFMHPKNRLQNIVKSLVAVPVYMIALPFLFVAGHHLFMRYFVRMFDHAGRVLAMVGLNPIADRNH